MDMPDMKKQIAAWVRQIDDVKAQVAQHWSLGQKAIEAGDIDSAISLLNRYFRLKVQLEGVEANLASMLHGYFSDK